MQATKIVFTLIAVLIVLPFIFISARFVWNSIHHQKDKLLWLRLTILLAALVGAVVFVITLYRFTLGYQIPLVAERVHVLFSEKLDGRLTVDEYRQKLAAQQLADIDFVPADVNEARDKYLSNPDQKNKADFLSKDYNIFLSENIIENEDKTVTVYAYYEKEEQRFFTELNLKQYGIKWKAIGHRIMTQQEFDDTGLNTRGFYLVAK